MDLFVDLFASLEAVEDCDDLKWTKLWTLSDRRVVDLRQQCSSNEGNVGGDCKEHNAESIARKAP